MFEIIPFTENEGLCVCVCVHAISHSALLFWILAAGYGDQSAFSLHCGVGLSDRNVEECIFFPFFISSKRLNHSSDRRGQDL